MSVRRSLFLLLLIGIGAPLFVFLRAQNRDNNAAVENLANLQLYVVGVGNVELSVSAIGTLSAERETSLSFLTTGRVEALYTQRDDYVLEGDPLVRLESSVQELIYAQAQLTLEQAELALEELLTVDGDQIALAEAAVDSALGAYYSIGSAVQPADIQAAQLAYDQAVRVYNDAVLARDTAPPGQYDRLAAEAGEASFNMEIARLQLEQLTSGAATRAQSGAAYARVVQARTELARVQAGPAQAQIDAAQAQVKRAEAALQQAERDLERMLITAPYDGVIAALNVEIGALVAPNTPVVTIADIAPLKLTVQVDEVDIRFVRVGAPVRVRLDALPEVVFPAVVDSVAAVGTTSSGIVSYDVEIALTGDDPRARVGMTADATIVVEEARDVVFAPNFYIRVDRFSGEAFVNVLRENNTVVEVPVQLGLQGQENSEILSGLSEGDLIALDLGGRGLNEFLGG
jgi:HlyD family secretion protein